MKTRRLKLFGIIKVWIQSEIGTTKYQGKIEQYDRIAELNLKVLQSPKREKREQE